MTARISLHSTILTCVRQALSNNTAGPGCGERPIQAAVRIGSNDLERTNMPIQNVLGALSCYVKIRKIKTALIANEEKIPTVTRDKNSSKDGSSGDTATINDHTQKKILMDSCFWTMTSQSNMSIARTVT